MQSVKILSGHHFWLARIFVNYSNLRIIIELFLKYDCPSIFKTACNFRASMNFYVEYTDHYE